MIKVKQHGDFSILTRYFQKLNKNSPEEIIEKYAQEGVSALRANTPVDTGKTADSWSYEIIKTPNGYKLAYYNSNLTRGILVAILI